MNRLLILLSLVSLLPAQVRASGITYKWSVQYLIDNSRASEGRSQQIFPRHNRGLALSHDGNFLYAGYNHSLDHGGEVRKIDLRQADYEKATVAILRGVLGKAIAVDDMGRVYLTNNTSIKVYDPDLKKLLFELKTVDCDGVGLVREKGILGLTSSLILYNTERRNQTLKRWVLSEDGMTITGAKPDGLGGSGEVVLPEAVSLRGLCVDPLGRVWVADAGASRVYRVGKDGRDISGMSVSNPIAIAFDGAHYLVTRFTDRQVAVLNDDMTIYGTLTVPWDELKLAPLGDNKTGALSGIAAVPGQGFYVANEGGQTADQKSTYGRADENAGVVEGVTYTDTTQDDNEPILHAVITKK